MIPKTRLDALTDGVFAFAMTLLVLGLDLPDSLRPITDGDLIAALSELDGPFLAYVISFFVLGLRWLGQARTKEEDPETASVNYGRWVLVHLFFITCMPFSTMVVGRFEGFTAAVCLYAANMILSSLAALRLSLVAEQETGRRPKHTGRIDLIVLATSALLSIAISLIDARYAMWAYLLNAATPWLHRWLRPKA